MHVLGYGVFLNNLRGICCVCFYMHTCTCLSTAKYFYLFLVFYIALARPGGIGALYIRTYPYIS